MVSDNYNIINPFPPETPETVETIISCLHRVSAQGTMAAQTNFDGASYWMGRKQSFNTVVIRATGGNIGAQVSLQIFQTADGYIGTGVRIATCSFTLTVGGAQEIVMTPVEGTVQIQKGTFFVLWGRKTATTWTGRTYNNSAIGLLNADVPLNTIPTAFTTAIVANTTPATFNPLTQATPESAAEVPIIARLKTV